MISQGYNLRFISLKDFVPGPGTLCPTNSPSPWDKYKTTRKNEAINCKNRQEKHFPLDG